LAPFCPAAAEDVPADDEGAAAVPLLLLPQAARARVPAPITASVRQVRKG